MSILKEGRYGGTTITLPAAREVGSWTKRDLRIFLSEVVAVAKTETADEAVEALAYLNWRHNNAPMPTHYGACRIQHGGDRCRSGLPFRTTSACKRNGYAD